MRYSLVASDYDSTLSPDGTMSARTARAIRLTRARGAIFAIITGRSAAGILFVLRNQDIDLEGLHVLGAGGADVVDSVTGTQLVRHSLDSSLITPVEEICQAEGVEMLVHCGSDIYTTDATGFHAQDEAYVNGMNLIETTSNQLSELVTERILVCGPPERLAFAVPRLRECFAGALEVHPSSASLVEVTAAGINKGRAIMELAHRLDIGLENTIAFGDNHNDVPLLTAAGTGIAVANAVPEVIEVADDVAPACADDGVAQYLEGVFG